MPRSNPPGLYVALIFLAGCTEYELDTLPGHEPRPASLRRPRDVTVEEEEVPARDTGAPDDPPPDDDVADTGDPTDDDPDPDGGDTGIPDDDEPPPELTAEVCEETEGDDCNGDLGYGDQCDPEDNTNGCSDAKFWAWCNRRNPTYPDIWYDFLHDWVDDRCDGSVVLVDDDGDGYQSFTCVDSDGVVYSCTTPLVLQFSRDHDVRFTAVAHTFPLDPGAGVPLRHDWPTAETPWLAFDRDGNGRIDDGSELFGSSTGLPSGARARHGFAALAVFDENGDGRVTPADPGFEGLLLWADADGDGESDRGELRGAGEAGVIALALGYRDEPRCDGLGNCARERAPFEFRGPEGQVREGSVVDVYVRSRPAVGPLVASAR